MKDFTGWLLDELDKRQWRPADLANKAGLGSGTLSHVLNGSRKPGADLCRAIAAALGEPEEKVFRLAGILSPLPAGEDETLHELIELLRNLSPEARNEILQYVRFRFQQEQK